MGHLYKYKCSFKIQGFSAHFCSQAGCTNHVCTFHFKNNLRVVDPGPHPNSPVNAGYIHAPIVTVEPVIEDSLLEDNYLCPQPSNGDGIFKQRQCTFHPHLTGTDMSFNALFFCFDPELLIVHLKSPPFARNSLQFTQKFCASRHSSRTTQQEGTGQLVTI